MTPHNPIHAAQQISHLAGNTSDKRLAMTLTGISTLLLALMVIREVKDLAFEHRQKSWVAREEGRRAENHGRGY